MNMKTHFQLAGISFRRKKFAQARLKPTDLLTLKAEPQNEHDPNALAVYRNDIQIGYVPRAINQPLAQLLRTLKHTVTVSACGPDYCQVQIEYEEPPPCPKPSS